MGERSVSQYNKYIQCPYAYYLERVEGVWQRPAAWLPQGTAVHKAAEEYELSGRSLTLEQTQEVYRESYATEVNRYAEQTPNTRYWHSSGPRYPGPQDIERRYGIGLEQVERYLRYCENHPDEVPTHIELPFRMKLGSVVVRGYIDQVLSDRVRDLKTGKSPGDDIQLATYAEAVRRDLDLPLYVGDYWMGQSGKPTYDYDLSQWTTERLTEEFEWLDQQINEERFEPDPEPKKCDFCSVNTSCPFRAYS